ncbi:MAG TPA: cbb3-type cytochrome oxidase assembly protein CcoS [Sphingobacterium sp.]|nr:cbb3-type cytochrome oxidase assembly protein CcoS [Sphingobacterium sp.]
MGIIFFLIACSVFVALIFLGAFLWASKTGQHEDTYTPAMRVLFDDGVVPQENEDDEKEDKPVQTRPDIPENESSGIKSD